ncbi:TetR/AcrR family transcriptional regulator [Spirosoma endbachense]|uniref:TetR family transcriptional regulator n=1 Tax=Spirosoma endbachense TaxID=2666025 RepID=A0A6P1VVM5_9BACT|nr:TetR family transcriptional regulator [Spirosoma endbachense]QHV97143.1 TetR family transcriptional regulator [Spirosoma endbachense]
MEKSANNALDGTTEERIKEVARKMFTQKGYAATRVKDIAEEAGMNIALLNYYFRSKEKLFDIIMAENIQQIAGSIKQIMMDPKTSLSEKVQKIVTFYIDLFTNEPELPLFVFREVTANPDKLVDIVGRKQITQSYFFKQLQAELDAHEISMHPMQIMMSIMSLVVMPFIARPLVQVIANQEPAEFYALMQERKRLIPLWISAILKAS